MAAHAQAALIQSLQNPALYDDCNDVRLIETHISYVLLTGRHAYKIKKAVNLGFLDFTTIESRRFYCERELRLNRRSAPALYLAVTAITGTPEAPVVGGTGPAIEYAVKMREFSQDSLGERVLARHELTPGHIDRLAATVAAFHAAAGRIEPGSPFGTAADTLALALENFTEVEASLSHAADRDELDALARWTRREHADRAAVMAGRRRDGFVRECHGDLHLGNIALVEGELVVFDCIEFNDRLRWSDVMSDVAFLVMDLHDRKRPDLAARFLNAYLEQTGDYQGLPLLRFFAAYRAMVRAKVALLRAVQASESAPSEGHLAQYRDYVGLAKAYTNPPRRGIVVTHGLTGSGKTTLSQALVELVDGIRIRTDVERKRLSGLDARAPSASGLDSGLYTAARTERTYRRVCDLARHAVAGGFIAVLDGAFLRRWQRDLGRALASELGVPLVIVDFVAPVATLRRRVETRRAEGLDASEADTAVLEHQLKAAEPLASDEQALATTYDAETSPDAARTAEPWRPVLERLGVTAA